MTPEQHANTEAFKQWALAEDRPDAEWVITREDARELVALAERAATLGRDRDEARREADIQMGAKLAAQMTLKAVCDVLNLPMVSLGNGWTEATPKILARIETIVDEAERGFTERDEARAEADRLREALRRAEALAAEWLQDARGGTMEEALAEIRAALAVPQTEEQT